MNPPTKACRLDSALARVKHRSVCAAVGLLALLPVLAPAGDWLLFPRANVTEAYSDNITLAETNTLDDLITTVMPGITVRGTSARLDLNLDYTLQYLKFLDNTEFDDLNHQMQGDAGLTMVEDLLYFNASARKSQQNTSNQGQFSQSNRSQTGNRTDVLFYQFGPSLRHSLGSWASVDASYLMNKSERTAITGVNPTGPGAEGNTAQFSLRSGPSLPRTPLGFSVSSREQERQDGQQSSLRSISADGGYVLNRFFTLTVEGGQEFNDFQTGRNQRDGPFWFVGGTWTPGPRTQFTGRYGSRFFGNTYNVSGSHTLRRAVFSFNYGEQVRTTNQIQSELVLVPLTDPFGNPILDPGFNPDILTPPDIPSLGDDIIISRNAGVNFSYAGRRQTFNARYFESKNEFQSTGFIETNRGASFDLSHRLTTVASAAVRGLWRESDSRNGQFRIMRITPSLQFSLSSHLRASLNYEFIDGKGNRGGNNINNFNNGNFTENAVTADIGYVF